MVGVGGVDRSTVELNIQDNATPALNKFMQTAKMTDSAIMSSGRNALTYSQSTDKLTNSVKQSSGQLTALGNNYAILNHNMDLSARSLGQHNTLMGQLEKTTQTTSQKMQQFGNFMKNNLTNVSLLAGGIAGLDDQFLGLHKAQVAAERSALMKEKADQKVVKAQKAVNDLVAQGKTGTQDYEIKLRDLELAQDAAGIATERATVAQETLNERTEDFWIGILPNMIFVGGSAIQMITNLGINSTTLSKIIPVLGTSFAGLSAQLGITSTAAGVTKISLMGVVGVAAPLTLALGGVLRVMDDFQLLSKTISAAVKGDALASLKALKAQLDALTLVKFDDPKSWFNVLNPAKGIIELSGIKKQVDVLIAGIESGKITIGNMGATTQETTKAITDFGVSLDALSNKAQKTVPDLDALSRLLRDEKGNIAFDNAKTKAQEFTGTIKGFNNTLLETARNYNVNTNVINENTAASTDSMDIIIRKNLALKQAINNAKGHTQATDTDTTSVENYSAALFELEFLLGQKVNPTLGLTTQQLKDAIPIIQQQDAAVQGLRNAWDTATKFINNDFDGFFEKFQTTDDKLEKLIKKDMKQLFKIAPELQVEWKLLGKEDQLKQRLEQQFKLAFQKVTNNKGEVTISPRVKLDDKQWDDIATEMIKDIDSATKGKSPLWNQFKSELEKAIESSDTGSALEKLANDPKFAEFFDQDMEVSIAQESLNKLGTLLRDAITNKGKGWDTVINPRLSGVPGGTQYTDEQKDKIWADEEAKGGWNTHTTYSDYWSTLTPQQKKKLKKMGLVPQSTGPDSLDDNGPPGPNTARGIQGVAYGGGNNKANPLDIQARQYVQITKDINILERATVTLTKDNNFLARTIAQMTKNLNVFARSIVETTKDYNVLARVTVQNTKNNNVLARTQVQLTKNNNVLARTIVQVGQDMQDASSDADDFASSLNKVASAARSAASAIRSIPKPPSGVQRFATGGDFITSGPELIMVGDNPSGKERVQVTPLTGSPANRYVNAGQAQQQLSTVNLYQTVKIDGNGLINDREFSKRVKLNVGERRDRFG